MRTSYMRVLLFAALPWLGAAPVVLAGTALEPEVGPPDGFGGGEFAFHDVVHITDEQRAEIWKAVQENIRALEAEGRLAPALGAHPLLGWPLRLAGSLTDPGYHAISNFVDQDPNFPGSLRDYFCGGRTYDNGAGYNHAGIDYFTWPFGWYKMDNGHVEIVAAAPGTIVFKSDGNFDRSCTFNNNPWNSVYVRHADNSVAVYGHMKNGSLTSKPVGATVVEGEYLGIVGSSGNSTGPHLHFEVYDSSGVLNDPYQGTCNAMNPDSWWQSQRPYHDSAVNHVSTNFLAPSFPPCPMTESPNEASSFVAGSTVYFVTYYRDQLMGQVSQYRVLRPDSSVYSSWSHSIGANHYAASYWYWSFANFASTGPAGTWQFEVTYQGQTYTRSFTVNLGAASGRVPDRDGTGLALRLSKATVDDVTLSWSPSCVGSDTDYEVYEGILGIYYTHDPHTCTTGGSTSITLPPFLDSAYYLVVPTNGVREGSYGTDSTGAERPPGANPCLLQTTSCP